ncbi:hypothetical protein DACRYDRAFT_104166 [Dacryopinax primogenitus]|uniref:BTB domain-containing protein n=1 Tax=Dacryopinax primogenitus (strain DJM 731) TaxID=1858805 RepID=M5G606_DACPD|nr:uncharacterized protein DACRYDRAFT_104166 [Dacryopinax primogenitus]EJU05681.1 hypothetical protein DACRYDRAFT_104166 [Dacryopinax primogenitus]
MSVPFEVPAVFLDPDADLTLKSSDGVIFKIFKGILVFGSQFFRDMFKHAHPGHGNDDEPVKWDEPADLIVLLLYQLYPMPKPTLIDLDQVSRVLIVAEKWGMASATECVKVELLNFLDQRPIQVIKLASRLELKDIHEKAIHEFVKQHDPMDKRFRADLEDIDVTELARWYDLRQSCIQEFKGAMSANLFCNSPSVSSLMKDITRHLEGALSSSLIVNVFGTQYMDMVWNSGSKYCDCWHCSQKTIGERLTKFKREVDGI